MQTLTVNIRLIRRKTTRRAPKLQACDAITNVAMWRQQQRMRNNRPMRDAVIFDMDGTLCDTSGIEHYIVGDDKDFAAFHAASADCPPRTEIVAAAKAEHTAGRAILVVTSRDFIWRDVTLTWLTQHGVPHDALYMRIVGDYRRDVEIKTDIHKQINDDGFNVITAWDDKPALLDLWRANGIEVNAVGG